MVINDAKHTFAIWTVLHWFFNSSAGLICARHGRNSAVDGFGHSYGDYGENDLDTTYSVKAWPMRS